MQVRADRGRAFSVWQSERALHRFPIIEDRGIPRLSIRAAPVQDGLARVNGELRVGHIYGRTRAISITAVPTATQAIRSRM